MVGFNRISEVFFALCKSVDTPVSLGLWLRFKYGEHAELAAFTIDPNWYCTADSFHVDYICAEYLSKYKGLQIDVDLKEVALSKFATSELSCQNTNARLAGSRRGISPRVSAVMFTAQRKIATVLGEYNDSWYDMCKWGPGATFTLKGSDAHLDNKIREDQISITATAVPYFRRVISDDYAWLSSRGIPAEGPVCLISSEFQEVKGCRVTTVPKNAKTDRTIAIEPTGNSFLQGGLGNYFRKRLKRIGIDLDDQSLNQNGAKVAWEDGLATVDLSAASDTISRELVFQLLPLDWAMLIENLRSPYYLLKGEWKWFQKVSSMGNGFTFELESLIFWALAQSVLDIQGVKGRALVYGDDIILKADALELLREVFDYCGFTINIDKTHWESPFRESCGKHYFQGHDVTPIYQKEVPDELEEIYRMANRIRRLAFRLGCEHVCDARFRSAWLAAIRDVDVRHATPIESEDDDGLALPKGEIVSRGLCLGFDRHGMIKLPVLSFKAIRISLADQSGLLAYWLRFTPSEPFNGRVAVRRHGKFVVRRRHYRAGCSDAAWC